MSPILALVLAVSGAFAQERLLFVGRKAGEARQLWTVGADGKGLAAVTRSPQDKKRPAVSADGRAVFANHRGDLLSVDLASGRETQLESSAGGVMWDCPAWSPDGNTLVAMRVVTLPKDDADLWRLVPPASRGAWYPMPGMEFNPAFSPDGKKLAFAKFDARAGGVVREAIWTIDLAKGEARSMWDDGADNHHPVWAGPETIVYVSNVLGNPDLWKLELTSGKTSPVATSPEVESEPAVSPDGKKLAYSLSRGAKTTLAIMDLPDGAPRAMELGLDEAREPVWIPVRAPGR